MFTVIHESISYTLINIRACTFIKHSITISTAKFNAIHKTVKFLRVSDVDNSPYVSPTAGVSKNRMLHIWNVGHPVMKVITTKILY